MLVLLLIPSGMYIVLEIKNFYIQLKLGNILTFFFVTILKYCALLLRENDIRNCIDYIQSDWRNVRYMDERRIMLKNANFGRRLMIICSVLIYGGVTFYYVAVLLICAKIKEKDTNFIYRWCSQCLEWLSMLFLVQLIRFFHSVICRLYRPQHHSGCV